MNDVIKRRSRKENFTTVNNEYLQDAALSWKAKGLITYIMSLPPDWRLNVRDLKNRSKDGRDATAAGLRELIENGYCQRLEIRKNGGEFGGYSYEVSDLKEFAQPGTETPFTVNPGTENPFTVNPETEKPNTGNPQLINTNYNQDSFIQNTDNRVEPQTLFAPEPTPELSEKKTLFRNSAIYQLVRIDANGCGDYSEFEKKFATPEFAPVDLVYYFHAVADWSDQKNMKRTANGWLATVRNFIRGDMEKNKLHLKQQCTMPGIDIGNAVDFLNNNY